MMTNSLPHTHRSTLREIRRRTIVSYQWAVYASFAFIFAGLIIALFSDQTVGTEMDAPSHVLRRMIDLHPSGFFGMGIGIMILAPIEMLIDAAVTFFRRGDKRYALITAAVALILSLSILISFLKG